MLLKGLKLNPLYLIVLVGMIMAFVSSIGVVFSAIQADNLDPDGNPENVRLGVNSFVQDTSVTLERLGIFINTGTTAAVGDSAPGVEATTSFATVNNAGVLDNYAYQFRVKESSVAAWSAGTKFRIRVFGYDSAGPTSTLLATLYAQQSVVDDLAIEGITVTVDLGMSTAIHDSFDIIVQPQ